MPKKCAVKLEITSEEDAILYYEKTMGRNQTIRKRAIVLYAATKGTSSVAELCRITESNRQFVDNTLKGYKAKGIDYIYQCGRSKRVNHLDERYAEVVQLIESEKPSSILEFAALLKEKLGISLTKTPIFCWLKKQDINFSKQDRYRQKRT